MADKTYLAWPFFEERHRRVAAEIEAWAASSLPTAAGDLDATCRALARVLGEAGWLVHAVPEDGTRHELRTICLIREILARHSALADFAFVMQGLGSATIALFGTPAQRAKHLPPVRAGTRLAAFALSEPEAGSDVAAMRTTARKIAAGWRLDGEKTWFSNGGIAGHYVVFARAEAGITAFLVEADRPGLTIAERIAAVAPHPLARLVFADCRVPDETVLGAPGEGMKLALATLDLFRPSVGAAALGLARRAYDAALERARTRQLFGAPMGKLQLVQAKLAGMAMALDASALLVYRAAWARDTGARRITREAAMAKLFATEEAQRIIDEAVQIFGGEGVRQGSVAEELYREIRALRIYEGASEVQQIIIARQELGL